MDFPERSLTAIAQHSVAGVATLATPVAADGVRARPVRRVGAAEAAAADGVEVDSAVVVDSGGSLQGREPNEQRPLEDQNVRPSP
jgi:hypothetical protein